MPSRAAWSPRVRAGLVARRGLSEGELSHPRESLKESPEPPMETRTSSGELSHERTGARRVERAWQGGRALRPRPSRARTPHCGVQPQQGASASSVRPAYPVPPGASPTQPAGLSASDSPRCGRRQEGWRCHTSVGKHAPVLMAGPGLVAVRSPQRLLRRQAPTKHRRAGDAAAASCRPSRRRPPSQGPTEWAACSR